MMDEKDVLHIFEKSGALLSGHFLLSSGKHSDSYLQAAVIMQHPNYARLLGRELAKRFSDQQISVIIGPALGGITLSFAVAAALEDTRAIFAERDEKTGEFILRRGFQLTPADQALVVEDIITTGSSVKEVVKMVRASGAQVAGVGTLAERAPKPVCFNLRKEMLLRLPLNIYAPGKCPLCRQEIPMVKPGSRKR